jgi:hypothetical protein
VHGKARNAFSRPERTGATVLRCKKFHEKLRDLKFFDPACGCGNFLVIAYRELRKLEHAVIKAIGGQVHADDCRVNVDQFYGIEIDEWPAQIAKVSLWQMDHLMNREFAKEMCGFHYDRIPLVTSPNIYHANVLRMDLPEGMNYIFGNPPYIGSRRKNKEQSEEIMFFGVENGGDIDYVCCWIIKASHYMNQYRQVRSAFVITNSIYQGEQVPILWKLLFNMGIYINFAVPYFKWSNDDKNGAAVFVTIVGISYFKTSQHINAYLKNAHDIWITKRTTPLSNVPHMKIGSVLLDDGNYTLEEESMKLLLQKSQNLENTYDGL